MHIWYQSSSNAPRISHKNIPNWLKSGRVELHDYQSGAPTYIDPPTKMMKCSWATRGSLNPRSIGTWLQSMTLQVTLHVASQLKSSTQIQPNGNIIYSKVPNWKGISVSYSGYSPTASKDWEWPGLLWVWRALEPLAVVLYGLHRGPRGMIIIIYTRSLSSWINLWFHHHCHYCVSILTACSNVCFLSRFFQFKSRLLFLSLELPRVSADCTDMDPAKNRPKLGTTFLSYKQPFTSSSLKHLQYLLLPCLHSIAITPSAQHQVWCQVLCGSLGQNRWSGSSDRMESGWKHWNLCQHWVLETNKS